MPRRSALALLRGCPRNAIRLTRRCSVCCCRDAQTHQTVRAQNSRFPPEVPLRTSRRRRRDRGESLFSVLARFQRAHSASAPHSWSKDVPRVDSLDRTRHEAAVREVFDAATRSRRAALVMPPIQDLEARPEPPEQHPGSRQDLCGVPHPNDCITVQHRCADSGRWRVVHCASS